MNVWEGMLNALFSPAKTRGSPLRTPKNACQHCMGIKTNPQLQNQRYWRFLPEISPKNAMGHEAKRPKKNLSRRSLRVTTWHHGPPMVPWHHGHLETHALVREIQRHVQILIQLGGLHTRSHQQPLAHLWRIYGYGNGAKATRNGDIYH